MCENCVRARANDPKHRELRFTRYTIPHETANIEMSTKQTACDNPLASPSSCRLTPVVCQHLIFVAACSWYLDFHGLHCWANRWNSIPWWLHRMNRCILFTVCFTVNVVSGEGWESRVQRGTKTRAEYERMRTKRPSVYKQSRINVWDRRFSTLSKGKLRVCSKASPALDTQSTVWILHHCHIYPHFPLATRLELPKQVVYRILTAETTGTGPHKCTTFNLTDFRRWHSFFYFPFFYPHFVCAHFLCECFSYEYYFWILNLWRLLRLISTCNIVKRHIVSKSIAWELWVLYSMCCRFIDVYYGACCTYQPAHLRSNHGAIPMW